MLIARRRYVGFTSFNDDLPQTSTNGIYGMIDVNLICFDNEANKDIIFHPEYFKHKGYYTIGLGKLFHHYAPEKGRNLFSDLGYSQVTAEH